ncbi:hypothetical protein ACLK1S_05470 [Escherichia coli]
MRNGDSRPLHKRRRRRLLRGFADTAASEVVPEDTFALNKWLAWWKRVWLISVLKPMSSITLRGPVITRFELNLALCSGAHFSTRHGTLPVHFRRWRCVSFSYSGKPVCRFGKLPNKRQPV